MADDIKVNPAVGVSDPAVATDDISSKHYQKIKIGWGADGSWNELEDTAAKQLPVGGSAVGAVNEAAPASDTASAGLNGRLQRVAQRLTSLMTGIVLAAGSAIIGKTIRAESTLTAQIANGATVSAAVDLRGYIVVGIILPSTFDGTTLTFQVSHDNATFQALYDATNTQVSMTVAASRSYAAWAELQGWPYLKVVAGTAQSTTATDVLIQVQS